MFGAAVRGLPRGQRAISASDKEIQESLSRTNYEKGRAELKKDTNINLLSTGADHSSTNLAMLYATAQGMNVEVSNGGIEAISAAKTQLEQVAELRCREDFISKGGEKGGTTSGLHDAIHSLSIRNGRQSGDMSQEMGIDEHSLRGPLSPSQSLFSQKHLQEHDEGRDSSAAAKALLSRFSSYSTPCYLALSYFTAAIELSPATSLYYYTRGNLFARLLEYKLAIFDYTIAIQVEEPQIYTNAPPPLPAALVPLEKAWSIGAAVGGIGGAAGATGVRGVKSPVAMMNSGMAAAGAVTMAAPNITIESVFPKGPHGMYPAVGTNEAKRVSTYYCARGQAFRCLGKVDDSISDFKKASKLDPDQGAYYYEIGVSLYELGDIERALQLFSIALHGKKSIPMTGTVHKYQKYLDNQGTVPSAGKRSTEGESLALDLKMRFDIRNMSEQDFEALDEEGATVEGLKFLQEEKESEAQSRKVITRTSSHFHASLNMPIHNHLWQSAFMAGKITLNSCMNVKCRLYRGNTLREIGAYRDAIIDLELACQHGESGNAHNLLGLAYFGYEAYPVAALHFRKAVDMANHVAIFHNNLGLALFQLERYEEALTSFHEAHARDPNNATIFFDRANCEIAFKKYTEALSDLDEAIARVPDDENMYHSKGIIYHEQGQTQFAIQQFLKALSFNSVFKPSLFHLGLCYHAQSELFLALDCFAKVIKIDPLDRRAYESLGLVYCDLMYFNIAVGAFSKAIELSVMDKNVIDDEGESTDVKKQMKNDGDVEEGQGSAIRGNSDEDTEDEEIDGKDLVLVDEQGNKISKQEAKRRLEEIKKRGHNNGVIWFYKGKAFVWLGRYEDALESFNQALKNNCIEPQVYNGRAIAYKYLHKYHKAIDDLTQAIAMDNENVEYLFNRALCYMEVEEYLKAIHDLSDAIVVNKNEAKLFYLRGKAKYALQDYEECILDMNEALKLDPRSSDNHDVYYVKGLAYANTDRHKEAIEQGFNFAVSLAPDKPEYLHERAKSLQCTGKYDESVADFSKVIILQPCNAHAYFRRGFSYKNIYKFNNATADWEKAKFLQPHNPNLIVNPKRIYDVDYIILCKAGDEPPYRSFMEASVTADQERTIERDRRVKLICAGGSCHIKINASPSFLNASADIIGPHTNISKQNLFHIYDDNKIYLKNETSTYHQNKENVVERTASPSRGGREREFAAADGNAVSAVTARVERDDGRAV